MPDLSSVNYKYFYNPYVENAPRPATFPIFPPTLEKSGIDSIISRIADWSRSYLFNDYEKEVDFTGKAIYVIDWGIYGVWAGFEAIVMGHHFFPDLHFDNLILSIASRALSILAIPVYAFSLFVAIFFGFMELININRAYNLLINFDSENLNPIEKLFLLRNKYFSITSEEHNKMIQLIETKFPNLSIEEKAKGFYELGKKVIELKFEALKRRITPEFAEEVTNELNYILNNADVPVAMERAAYLVESLTRQAKNKIAVHTLGMIGFAISTISIIGFLLGVASFVFVMAIGAISTTFFALRFFVNKGSVEVELETYKTRIKNIRSEEVGQGIPLPSN